jgi:hypothetical protein
MFEEHEALMEEAKSKARNIKSIVSSDYLKTQMDRHKRKVWCPNHVRVLMTGATRECSIGQAIAGNLRLKGHNVSDSYIDVNNIPEYHNFQFFSALVM